MNILEIIFAGNVNELHDSLIAQVTNFQKVEWDSIDAWNVALPEDGQVFSKGNIVWIHYADDVDVNAVQVIVNSFGDN